MSQTQNLPDQPSEEKVETTKKPPARYSLYANMNLSLKTVDRFIWVIGLLLVASIIFAICQ